MDSGVPVATQSLRGYAGISITTNTGMTGHGGEVGEFPMPAFMPSGSQAAVKLCIEILMRHGPGKGHALPTSDSASDSSDKSHMV